MDQCEDLFVFEIEWMTFDFIVRSVSICWSVCSFPCYASIIPPLILLCRTPPSLSLSLSLCLALSLSLSHSLSPTLSLSPSLSHSISAYTRLHSSRNIGWNRLNHCFSRMHGNKSCREGELKFNIHLNFTPLFFFFLSLVLCCAVCVL
jgi:hypothetical protein